MDLPQKLENGISNNDDRSKLKESDILIPLVENPATLCSMGCIYGARSRLVLLS